VPRRRILTAVVLLAVALYLLAFVSVFRASRQDERGTADAIVVLGAAQYNGKPSPVLRARLDHALQLFNDSLAPRVLVTGGVGEGDRISEAAVGERYLLSQGVRPSAVVVLPEGRSTEASMASAAQWLRERGLKRALLVSDPFHMLRLRLEARRVHIGEAYTSPTTTSPISESWTTELPYLLAEAAKIPVAWVRAW